jgi:hypothetical protein
MSSRLDPIPRTASTATQAPPAAAPLPPLPGGRRPGRADLWWLHPAVALSGMVGSTALAAWLIPADTYLFEWNVPKVFDGAAFALVVFWLSCFAVGTMLVDFAASAAARRRRRASGYGVRRAAAAAGPAAAPAAEPVELLMPAIRTLFWITTALTYFGYVCWIAMAIKRGMSFGLMMDVITGQGTTIFDIKREQFETIPGVTTATQFGIAALVFGMLLQVRPGTRSRAVFWAVLGLVPLTLLRALFLSERLALLELVLPAGLVWLRYRLISGDPPARPLWLRTRVLANITPVVGPLALLVMFGTFEYFRSWSTFYSDRQSSLAMFAVTRLTGYYATSFNNGILILDQTNWFPRLPRWTLDWLWSFPGMRGMYGNITGSEPQDVFDAALYRRLSPEFNNQGGMFLPAFDLGLLVVPLFWVAAGAAMRSLHRRFVAGAASGLLLYPVLILSVAELPRILYLASTRVFPSLAVIVAVLLFAPLLRSRAAAARRQASKAAAENGDPPPLPRGGLWPALNG